MSPHHPHPDRRSRDTWSRWLWTWSVLATPLVCVAILDWGPVTVLSVAAFGLMAAILVVVAWATTEPDVVRARLSTLPVRELGVATAVGSVAIPVLTRAPVSVVGCVLAAAVLTSPVRSMRRRAAPEARPEPLVEVAEAPAPAPAVELSPAVVAMTDQQLCTAWRHSFRTLETARSVPETARVVTLRQAFLDELETRNEPGLRAWLASGARAASDPERFLSAPAPLHRPLSAWPPNQAPAGE